MKSLSDVSPSKICSEHLIANIRTVVYDRCAANVTLLTTCEMGIPSSFMLELMPNICDNGTSFLAVGTTIFVGSGGRPHCSRHADRCWWWRELPPLWS